jgi:DNA-binding NarL/FixJ family response regulator
MDIQITYQIHAEKIPTRVILVTAYDDPEQIFHAMRAGASGYCAKNIRPDALAQVIRNVSAGYYAINEMIMDQNQLESWLQEQGIDEIDIYKDQDTAAQTLSSREMEVLIS